MCRRFLAFCVITGSVAAVWRAKPRCCLFFARLPMTRCFGRVAPTNSACGRRRYRARGATLFQGWRLRWGATPGPRRVHPRERLILCKSAISNRARRWPRLILFTEIWKMRAPTHPLVCLPRFFSLENPFRNLPQKQHYRARMQTQEVERSRACMGKCVLAPWAKCKHQWGLFRIQIGHPLALSRLLRMLFHLCMCAAVCPAICLL
jgi:hypothetical protein